MTSGQSGVGDCPSDSDFRGRKPRQRAALRARAVQRGPCALRSVRLREMPLAAPSNDRQPQRSARLAPRARRSLHSALRATACTRTRGRRLRRRRLLRLGTGLARTRRLFYAKSFLKRSSISFHSTEKSIPDTPFEIIWRSSAQEAGGVAQEAGGVARRVTDGKGRVTDWKGRVTDGKGRVTDGKGRAAKAREGRAAVADKSASARARARAAWLGARETPGKPRGEARLSVCPAF